MNLKLSNYKAWREAYLEPATEQAVRNLCELNGLTLKRTTTEFCNGPRDSFELRLPNGQPLVSFYADSPIERFVQAVTNWKRTGDWRGYA